MWALFFLTRLAVCLQTVSKGEWLRQQEEEKRRQKRQEQRKAWKREQEIEDAEDEEPEGVRGGGGDAGEDDPNQVLNIPSPRCRCVCPEDADWPPSLLPVLARQNPRVLHPCT